MPHIYTIALLLVFSKGFLKEVQSAKQERDCIPLDVTITQKIDHLGFHRDLNWLIETNNLNLVEWLNSSCSIALRLDVGRGFFVNPDQAEDLKRLGKLDILIDGSVDVEAIAHQATGHIVYIFLNNKSQISGRISVKLPIHLRYQRPLMGGHGKVLLTKPSFLVKCPESNNIICGLDKRVFAPKSSEEFNNIQTWKNVSYKADFEEMELLVPVGNLDDYGYVAVVSCILGCVGCIYILSLIKES
ncbi:phosphatidylinositol-glycan biosynthesis class X protein [Euwallacea similis]|uniref:phosphatidylinositol-glycan biosynthesis class X protein n=1 Tax=Euwallacea similis TaxID=1736056 RepID=UPI00344C373B